MRTSILVGLVTLLAMCTLAGGTVEGQTLRPRGSQPFEGRTPPGTLPPPREPTIESRAPGVPSLGVRVVPVTEELARLHQLKVRQGAFIENIERGSPAEIAGLPSGAVIVAFDGRRIDSPQDLAQALRVARGGEEVELTYYQQDRLARRKVRIGVSGAPSVTTSRGKKSSVSPTDSLVPPAPLPGDASSAAAPPPLVPPAVTPPGNVPPVGTPPSGAPGGAVTPLERQFGGGGSRPLLGRLGRILDNVATPAAGVEPAPVEVRRVEPTTEVELLRQQLQELTKQVDLLRRQVESLERKVSSRD